MIMSYEDFKVLHRKKATEFGTDVPTEGRLRQRYSGYAKAAYLLESDGNLKFRKENGNLVFTFEPKRK